MFRLDAGSGVPIYRQLVQQVRSEVMLGRLRPGERLPTVKEVVDSLSINPNTVVKAYGELEHEGLIVRRQGIGTFVAPSPPTVPMAAPASLKQSLVRWVARARDAGLTPEQIRTLVAVAVDEGADEEKPEAGAGGVA
jgi:GntR family transcriptional regulator